MTLVEFLRARLDEDEQAAKAASPGGWTYGDVDSVAGGSLYDQTRMIGSLHYEQPKDHDGRIVRHLLAHEADANGEHIARHDPARVLRKVDANRRIVDWCSERDRIYVGVVERDVPQADDFVPGKLKHQADSYVLRLLALPYAEHPDYREEWKP